MISCTLIGPDFDKMDEIFRIGYLIGGFAHVNPDPFRYVGRISCKAASTLHIEQFTSSDV